MATITRRGRDWTTMRAAADEQEDSDVKDFHKFSEFITIYHEHELR